jgi:vacuolar-type H+-ATPase subunit H
MREVIQQVIATEAGAKQLVQAARADAERLLTEARQQAQATLENARQTARAEALEILAVAAAQAEQQKAERVNFATAEMEKQIHLDETMRQPAVEAAERCLCGLDRPRRAT